MKKSVKAIIAGMMAPAAAFAEGATGTAYATPGLSDAIDNAKATATQMATDIVPAAVTIIFTFAGLLGVYLIWRVFKKGVSGR